MATNPEERIKEWKRDEGHTDSEILASGLTYDEAQEQEALEAELRDCYYKSGGERNDESNWSVYHVWGGTVPDK